MAIQAREVLAPFWYTPASEEGAANPTRFKLRPLTGLEAFDAGIYAGPDGNFRASSQGVRNVLGHALQGWENVVSPGGDPMEFNITNPAASLRALPYMVLSELFNKVIEVSNLTGDQEKN